MTYSITELLEALARLDQDGDTEVARAARKELDIIVAALENALKSI